MLQRGDLIPHFKITNHDGDAVAYSQIWQRCNLVLVTLPASRSEDAFKDYVSQLTAQIPAFGPDTACVMTRDFVSGIPCPGVVVGDRWGEILNVAAGPTVDELPRPHEIVEWIEFMQRQCPECQGEAK